eukprot:4007283-Pyramimonas_sp.AAC.2
MQNSMCPAKLQSDGSNAGHQSDSVGYIGDDKFVGHDSSMRITGDLCHLTGVVSLFLYLVLSQDATGWLLIVLKIFSIPSDRWTAVTNAIV